MIELWGDFPKLVDPVIGIQLSLPWIYTTRFYAKPGAIDEVIQEILANPFPPSVSGIYEQSRAITSYDASARLHGSSVQLSWLSEMRTSWATSHCRRTWRPTFQGRSS